MRVGLGVRAGMAVFLEFAAWRADGSKLIGSAMRVIARTVCCNVVKSEETAWWEASGLTVCTLPAR